MRILTEFGKFWYELLVGDDWKIAVSVVLALTLTALLLTQTAPRTTSSRSSAAPWWWPGSASA